MTAGVADHGSKMAERFPATARYLAEAATSAEGEISRETQRAAVKELLAHLSQTAPGHSVELRVPPFGAIQIIAGPRHRRGTPSATIEMETEALVDLCVGSQTWSAAVDSGRVLASGERADLSSLMPLVSLDST